VGASTTLKRCPGIFTERLLKRIAGVDADAMHVALDFFLALALLPIGHGQHVGGAHVGDIECVVMTPVHVGLAPEFVEGHGGVLGHQLGIGKAGAGGGFGPAGGEQRKRTEKQHEAANGRIHLICSAARGLIVKNWPKAHKIASDSTSAGSVDGRWMNLKPGKEIATEFEAK